MNRPNPRRVLRSWPHPATLLAIAVSCGLARATLTGPERPDARDWDGWATMATSPALEPPTSAEPTATEPADVVTQTAATVPTRPRCEPTAAQREAYASSVTRSVLDLQLCRSEQSLARPDGSTVALLDLDSMVGAWILLGVRPTEGPGEIFHLELTDPRRVRAVLDPEYPDGIVLEAATGRTGCPLFDGELAAARAAGTPYAPLCDGAVALRNPVAGRKTRLEWTTDALRDHVWGGEQLTVLVRDTVFKDAHLVTSDVVQGDAVTADAGPAPAELDPERTGALLAPTELDLPLASPRGDGRMSAGAWYPVDGPAGVYASVVQAGLLDEDLLRSHADRGGALDAVERTALTYVVAFDLSAFDLHFELGTDHPRVGWSERAAADQVDRSLPGPDGFATDAPLVRTGMVNPAHAARLVGAFTGGFKRNHGAFKTGPMADVPGASHYGFIEEGTVVSRLQPGLATVLVTADGRVDVVGWTPDLMPVTDIRYARQNGVPLLDLDPETGRVVPGALVTRWSDGNWSGSAEGRLRTVRAAVCIQDTDRGRFLLYGYFSGATPTAMTPVLEAYGCGYAAHLDMNALEHTYLAVYGDGAGQFAVRHLVDGMEVLDKAARDGTVQPRFVAFPDNRDFFYLLRKDQG